MKNISLFLFLFLGTINVLAQRNPIEVGVNAHGMVTVTNGSPWQMGAGNYVGLWLNYRLDHFSTLTFGFGHRHLGGYQRLAISVSESFYPTEYQRDMITYSLENLNHLHTSFSWTQRFNSHSPWSYSLGTYAAWLTAVEGGSVEVGWTSSVRTGYFLTGFPFNSDFTINNEAVDFDNFKLADFTRLDYGLLVGIQYELSPGLQLQAQLTQGLRNQLATSPFPRQQQHYLTALALGFTAKIK
ncbi:MAG: hypothetical protein AAFY48_06130 [Bacteroidota bacterium]